VDCFHKITFFIASHLGTTVAFHKITCIWIYKILNKGMLVLNSNKNGNIEK